MLTPALIDLLSFTQRLLRAMQTRGVATAELHVLTTNAVAIGMYTKQGFRKKELVRGYYT